MKFGWLMKLLHIPRFKPSEEMVTAAQELSDILRRVDTEVNVRRNYRNKFDGERHRDSMDNTSVSRNARNLSQPYRRDQGAQ